MIQQAQGDYNISDLKIDKLRTSLKSVWGKSTTLSVLLPLGAFLLQPHYPYAEKL